MTAIHGYPPPLNYGYWPLALYVYEYLLHVGAQKSAQTFLSEIRWEKNITLGEPPGFLHSWWCVFWDLYCAAPDRREACEHSSEAKAFQDYSAAAAPSPVMGSMPPNDAMAAGPMAPGFFQSYGGGMRPPHNSLAGPGLPAMNMGPGVRGPWASPSGNSIPYSSSSPGSYSGPPGGGGPPGTPIMPSPGGTARSGAGCLGETPSHPAPFIPPPSPPDSTNSSENMYTIMNPIGPGTGRANSGPSRDPSTALMGSGMGIEHAEQVRVPGPGGGDPWEAGEPARAHLSRMSVFCPSAGSGDMDGLPKYSPGMTMSV
ncbi:Single-stranded DNA-binding protein 4 [Tupaia chinensis]|uniref:Single-stranded DNA-binding protein 4 n=1 Tax=Tupaia chinensis TaxID=246437 RepID=L9KW44_TUPCH|nr:Single-stranded DNA-binding protein 4 [Tupaia chinensis]